MASEAETVIAFLFKRSGKAELSFSEMYLTLSMELNWFKPDEAKTFINEAVKNNFLTKKNDYLRPGFEVVKVNVPLGFHPAGDFLKKDKKESVEKDLLDEIIDKISKEAEIDREKIYEEIKFIEKEKNIKAEIASIMVAKKYDIILDPFFKRIEENIF